jgi:hypothetical protein
MVNISHGDDYMIATKFLFANPNATVTNIDEFNEYLFEIAGENWMELTYLRSDAILDNVATMYGQYYWTNDQKTGTYIVFHSDALDAKTFQITHLQNDKVRSVENALRENGWTITMTTEALTPDPEITNYILVDHPSNQVAIRPERRNA